MPDREKVIKKLEECLSASCRGFRTCPYSDTEWDAVATALTLLREQETEYKPDGPDFTKHGLAVRWKCSNCQYYVLTKDEETKPNMKYCPNCGRAVKWDA